jgi:hypothetical protein
MATESSDDGLAADERQSDFVRLQQRTWMAAAPYLGAAGLAWVGAAFAQYKLNQTYAQDSQMLHGTARQAILQILSQALLYAGLGLFSLGLLVVVLRQHERWRHRDRVGSFVNTLDVEDGVTVRDPFGSPVDVTPSHERRLRDPAPDHPDWPHR